MRKSLRKFLLDKGYTRIKLTKIKTNHYAMYARINGKKGFFIVDTGASSSCVGLDAVENFNLEAEDSEVKAAGAGAVNMLTKVSYKNILEIGNWKKKKVVLILFNMSHVNTALIQHKAKPVDGIIGADILKKGRAVIDYEKDCLYLK